MSAPYPQKEMVDFNQSSMGLSAGEGAELIVF